MKHKMVEREHFFVFSVGVWGNGSWESESGGEGGQEVCYPPERRSCLRRSG